MSDVDKLVQLHDEMVAVRDRLFSAEVFVFFSNAEEGQRTAFARVASRVDDQTERVETLLLQQILTVLQANEAGLKKATKDAKDKLEEINDALGIIVTLTQFLNVVTAAFKFVLI